MLHYKPSLLAQDRRTPSPRQAFRVAKRLEGQYRAKLRRVAKHVGDIVTGFQWDDFTVSVLAQAALHQYAALLAPWAEAVSRRMVTEVAASNSQSWRKMSGELGRSIHQEIESAPTGQAMRASMSRQVELITSLPLDAAARIHQLTQQAISTGRRASEISDEIMNSGQVTRSRADLIARTEVNRTATELTKARAEHVGSTEFIWRTANDSSVRASHKKLNGKVFRWDQPPECDPGHNALPGSIWNCRCYPEVIIE